MQRVLAGTKEVPPQYRGNDADFDAEPVMLTGRGKQWPRMTQARVHTQQYAKVLAQAPREYVYFAVEVPGYAKGWRVNIADAGQ